MIVSGYKQATHTLIDYPVIIIYYYLHVERERSDPEKQRAKKGEISKGPKINPKNVKRLML